MNSGGAQYLLKNIDYTFWEECEVKCIKLYDYLKKYEEVHPIEKHIQKWTVDMWVVLWLYWKRCGPTVVHKDLDFSWATGTVNDYNRLNIFHLAGITNANNSDKFYKGKYINISPFDAYLKNQNIFNHISKDNATYEYIKIMKEYINNVYSIGKKIQVPVKKIISQNTNYLDSNKNKIDVEKIKQFSLITEKIYNGVYKIDNKICCDKNIWRSNNGQYIIFWTGDTWVLTYSKYENQIGANCGGIISNSSLYPYDNNWNNSDEIEIQI